MAFLRFHVLYGKDKHTKLANILIKIIQVVFLRHKVQTFRGQENYTLSKELPVWDEIITPDLLHITAIMVIIMTVIIVSI